jgi:hypothetical protein
VIDEVDLQNSGGVAQTACHTEVGVAWRRIWSGRGCSAHEETTPFPGAVPRPVSRRLIVSLRDSSASVAPRRPSFQARLRRRRQPTPHDFDRCRGAGGRGAARPAHPALPRVIRGGGDSLSLPGLPFPSWLVRARPGRRSRGASGPGWPRKAGLPGPARSDRPRPPTRDRLSRRFSSNHGRRQH